MRLSCATFAASLSVMSRTYRVVGSQFAPTAQPNDERPMTDRLTRSARTPEHYDKICDEYQRLGYRVVDEGRATTTLRYRDHGGVLLHAVILLFVGWWTLGVANLAYAMYRRHVTTHYVTVAHPE